MRKWRNSIDRPLLHDVPGSEAERRKYCQANADCHSYLGFADGVSLIGCENSQ
jgi:hypothetical protein